jgi:hypothetical protein
MTAEGTVGAPTCLVLCASVAALPVVQPQSSLKTITIRKIVSEEYIGNLPGLYLAITL